MFCYCWLYALKLTTVSDPDVKIALGDFVEEDKSFRVAVEQVTYSLDALVQSAHDQNYLSPIPSISKSPNLLFCNAVGIHSQVYIWKGTYMLI